MMMKMIVAMCVACMPWVNYAQNTENRLSQGAERALALDTGFDSTTTSCTSACEAAGIDNSPTCIRECEAFDFCTHVTNDCDESGCADNVNVGQQVLQWLKEAITIKNQFKACINKGDDANLSAGAGAPESCTAAFATLGYTTFTDAHFTDAGEAAFQYKTVFSKTRDANCSTVVKDQTHVAGSEAVCNGLGNCTEHYCAYKPGKTSGSCTTRLDSDDCATKPSKCEWIPILGEEPETQGGVEMGEHAAHLLRLLQRSQNKKNEFRSCLLDSNFTLGAYNAADNCKEAVCADDDDCTNSTCGDNSRCA